MLAVAAGLAPVDDEEHLVASLRLGDGLFEVVFPGKGVGECEGK